jgi:predicted nucleotidyltransferase
VTEARQRLAELAALIRAELGGSLLGLYLYGSLAADRFVEGRSDVDLFAVLEHDVDDERFEALRALHDGFVRAHPAWVERVEVAYVPRHVLRTLGGEPAGELAVISPGEPLNVHEVDRGWAINWYSVCTMGETVVGPPPLDLGPEVTAGRFRQAVEARLRAFEDEVRARAIAYVPAAQGYVVVTVCRALYALATGEQASKEEAAAWAAAQYPDWATFIEEALAAHRADVRPRHEATIRFVEQAAAGLPRREDEREA